MFGISHRASIDIPSWMGRPTKHSCPPTKRTQYALNETFGMSIRRPTNNLFVVCFIIYCSGDAISHFNSYISLQLILHCTRNGIVIFQFEYHHSLFACFTRPRVSTDSKCCGYKSKLAIAEYRYTFACMQSLSMMMTVAGEGKKRHGNSK